MNLNFGVCQKLRNLKLKIYTSQHIQHKKYIGSAKDRIVGQAVLYFSCVIVGITSALAVTVLKTFAHNVFQFTTYVNKILKLPYLNSILPILGIVLTVLIIRKFLNGSLEKGTAQIMIAVAKRSGFMPKTNVCTDCDQFINGWYGWICRFGISDYNYRSSSGV